MSVEADVFMFPVNNPSGWKVESIAGYNQLMRHILYATAELEEDYPDKNILVVFEANPYES